MAHEPLVELGDGVLVDEQQRQLGVAPHALGREHALGQRVPSGPTSTGCVGLLVGDEDLELALVAGGAAPAGAGGRGRGSRRHRPRVGSRRRRS